MPQHQTQMPQRIGDRIVENPRFEIVWNPLKEGQPEPYWSSLETCSCGYSIAMPGVGYLVEDEGYACKKCGEVHTVRSTERAHVMEQIARITAAGYPDEAARLYHYIPLADEVVPAPDYLYDMAERIRHKHKG